MSVGERERDSERERERERETLREREIKNKKERVRSIEKSTTNLDLARDRQVRRKT